MKISATHLARTYKNHGIKFKNINKVKKEIDFANPYYLNLFTQMHI